MGKVKAKRGPKKKARGTWVITLDDGTMIDAGYYPNPRMAVAAVLKRQKGTVRSVRYFSVPPTKAVSIDLI